MPDTISGLEYWFELQKLPEAEVIDRYAPSTNAIERGVGYYNLKPVTRIQTPDGHFYFRDGQQVLLYLSDWVLGRGDGPTRRDLLLTALGEPDVTLASRAGRANRQYVYPARGIAFSASADGVDFVELFPPTDIEGYRQTYYSGEPSFRR